MVRGLRLYAPSAERLGSTPGQGTRPHVPQEDQRSHAAQLRPGTVKWINEIEVLKTTIQYQKFKEGAQMKAGGKTEEANENRKHLNTDNHVS